MRCPSRLVATMLTKMAFHAERATCLQSDNSRSLPNTALQRPPYRETEHEGSMNTMEWVHDRGPLGSWTPLGTAQVTGKVKWLTIPASRVDDWSL